MASHDGITWVVPPGLTNPIDDQSGQPAYNSDVDLKLGPGDVLFLFWRTFDPNAVGGEEQLYYSTSVDGSPGPEDPLLRGEHGHAADGVADPPTRR